MRAVYALVGAFVAVAIDLAVNLLAALLLARTPAEQLANLSVWWLVGVIGAGLLAGWWLGRKVVLHPASRAAVPADTQTRGTYTEGVRMTRLTALLAYGKLRGQGIDLQDILLIGSRLDIDTTGK